MKSIRFWLLSGAICCAFVQSVRGVEAAEWKVLHSFGGSDGANPDASLIDVNGNFYGTTAGGGTYSNGTVFKLAPDGTETVLHSFEGWPTTDGVSPDGLIANKVGKLFGTTASGGGTEGYGTVFTLKPDGTETVLYVFSEGADGMYPEGGVTKDGAGNLYGTTFEGGYYDGYDCDEGCGIVFKLAPDGTETVLHAFQGWHQNDGEFPSGGLVKDKAGDLYGTTARGGGNGGILGTVFKIASDGTETFLHNFSGGTDGAYPMAGLIGDDAGNLYGTTYYGGSGSCYRNLGCGTVFRIAPDGTETVLYAFAGGNDGAHPEARLLMDKAGNLYGTTVIGGGSANCPNGGCGTVFKLAPDGTESVLHACTGGKGGREPEAGLIEDKAGNLYGTTKLGGAYRLGMVFKLTQ